MDKQQPVAQYQLSRRAFLQQMMAVGGIVVVGGGLTALAACSPGTEGAATQAPAGEQPVDLTHFIWVGGGQGDVPRLIVPRYIEEHPNVSIELFEGNNAETYPKMVAAREADPTKPLIHFGFFNMDVTVKGTQSDMWASLDPNKIPNMNDVYEGFRRPDNKGIGWGMNGLGILYNTEFVPEPPTSWLDLLDPKYKGKVVLWDGDFKRHLVPIAHALGSNEGDVEESWSLLSEAARNGQFLAFGTSNDAMKNPLVQGEAWITVMSNSFARTWADEGAPVGYAIPKEGQIAFPLLFQIVNGCTPEQIAVASDIINMYLEPETLSQYCNITKSIPASSKATLSEELQADPAFSQEAVENAMFLDWDTMAEQDAAWKERWAREVIAVMS